METLNNLNWQPITLEEVFDIKSGKRLENRNKIEGQRPFIGATDNSNGVTGFVANANSSLDKNTLGVNYNGAPCIAHYHPYECIFTDDVKHLHLKKFKDGKNILLSFIPIFEIQKCKYNYGYKFNENRMNRQKLYVPVDDDGKPDYNFMETYVSNKTKALLVGYKAFLETQLAELEHKDIPTLDEMEWKPIKLSSLFQNYHGKRLVKECRCEGNIPLLTANSVNNGVAEFIGNEDMKAYSNFVSVDMFCNTFVHPYTATGDDNIYFFKNDNLNIYVKHFICTCISKQQRKFSYGKQFRQQNADNLLAMLPVASTGEPDWDYMEQYAKNLMLRKYQQYLTFLDNQ